MKVPDGTLNIEKDINIHLENKKLSRMFFAYIFLLYVVVCMTKNCYNSSLASIVSEGLLTKSQTSLITAMFFLVYTPLQVMGGIFADKYSPERMIKIGLVGAAVANTIIFFNQSYYVMMAAWVFNGIIQFGIWPSIFKIISSQLVRSDRARMTFLISFTSTGGFAVSYIVSALVTNWRYSFAISAGSLLVMAVILHIFEKVLSPHMKRDRVEEPEIPTENMTEEEKVKARPHYSVKEIFIASGFFFVLLSTILSIVVSQSRSTLTSVMLVENYETVSPSLGNILTAVMLVAGLTGIFVAKKFAGKVKNEATFIALGTAALLPFLIASVFVGILPIAVMIGLLCIVAVIESAIGLFRNYFTLNFTKYGMSGTAAGVLNAGTAFSYVLVAYIMPRVAETFGWRVMLITWPVITLIAVLCVCCIIKRFAKFKNGEIDTLLVRSKKR